MKEIKKAKQESSAQSSCEIVVKKGNNAVDIGEICPYCGSEDTAMLDDFVDEETNAASEAWQCGACGSTFGREAKLDKDGRTILYSETHSARYA